MKEISYLSYLALKDMRKGFYLLRQKNAEGLCNGKSLVSISNPVKAGTIAELVKNGLIRQSITRKSLYLLTDEGRTFIQ